MPAVKKILIILAGLVIIGVVAVAILTRIKPSVKKNNSPAPQTKKVRLSPEESLKILYPNATDEEMSLLVVVQKSPKSATEPAVLSLAEKAAVTGEKIEFKNCAASPIVLKVRKGQKLTFVNKDQIEHTINLLGVDYKLGSLQEAALSANFKRSYGIFPYSCDLITIKRGLIYIPQN